MEKNYNKSWTTSIEIKNRMDKIDGNDIVALIDRIYKYNKNNKTPWLYIG